MVKAYMKMTQHKAEACNSQLASEESRSHWVPIPAVRIKRGEEWAYCYEEKAML